MSIKIALFRVRFDGDDFDVVGPPDLERVYATGVLVDGLVRWSSNPGNLSEKMLSELADKIEASRNEEEEPEDVAPDVVPRRPSLSVRLRHAFAVQWWRFKGIFPAEKRRRLEEAKSRAMLHSYLGGLFKHPVQ